VRIRVVEVDTMRFHLSEINHFITVAKNGRTYKKTSYRYIILHSNFLKKKEGTIDILPHTKSRPAIQAPNQPYI
jgi:hypothetical protein